MDIKKDVEKLIITVKGSLLKAALADKDFLEKIKSAETETEFRLFLIEWGITHGYKCQTVTLPPNEG